MLSEQYIYEQNWLRFFSINKEILNFTLGKYTEYIALSHDYLYERKVMNQDADC